MHRFVLIISIVLIAATSVAAKDWRGIVPLKSTLADVQRQFGFPKATKNRLVVNNGYWIYLFNHEEVHFEFAVDNFPGEKQCVMPVAKGTIIAIHILPLMGPSVSSLDIDEKRFKRFDEPFRPPPHDRVAYINEEDGLVIDAFQGKVSEITYVASRSDRLRCPNLYNNLNGFMPPIICGLPLDTYGDIRFEDEKARLDNFAIQIQNQTGAHGFIIVYAGRKSTVNQAQRRANRAKNYMVNVRGIESERLYAVDGGYHEELLIRLIIAPPGAAPPPLDPTLDPSQVQIVSAKRRTRKRN